VSVLRHANLKRSVAFSQYVHLSKSISSFHAKIENFIETNQWGIQSSIRSPPVSFLVLHRIFHSVKQNSMISGRGIFRQGIKK
jgi:hypothetical protein